MAEYMKQRWQRLVAFIIARLGESSTIQGLAAVLTLCCGYALAPEQIGAIAAIAAAVSAVLKIMLPDNWTKE